MFKQICSWFLIILFSIFSIFSMDQISDLSIKKIITMQAARQVVFLGNDTIVMHSNKYSYRENFHIVARNLFTNESKDLLGNVKFSQNNPVVVDDKKENILLMYCNQEKWRARVYNKAGIIYDIPPFPTYGDGNGWPPQSFSKQPNQLLLTITDGFNNRIQTYDYTTSVFTVEENITKFVNKHSELYPIKYIAGNKIICGKRGEVGGCVYDLTHHTLANDIPLSKFSQVIHASSDGAFVLFNNHWDLINCGVRPKNGDFCDCHEIPIVFLNDNKIMKIIDGNDDPKNNHKGRCGFAIHPNNQVIARLKNNCINYWHAYSGKKYPCMHQYVPIEAEEKLAYFNTKCLSFSADGTLVAGAFPGAYVVFEVPFEVLHGIMIEKKQFIWLWWALNTYAYCQKNKDIISLVINKIIEIAREIAE